MLITLSLFFITLSGLTALAFDLGHLLIVRNELQNAADAAALAGANCLNKTSTSSGTDCTSTTSSTLNWNTASLRANAAIALNKSDGTALVNATVSTGYKNLAGTPAGLQTSTPSPIGLYDKPAVMVSLSRSTGSNGGAPGMLLTSMFNVAPVPISATAVAVISSPGNIGRNSLIPVVINKCVFDLYWDSNTGQPKLATSSAAVNGLAQTAGEPFELKIGSAYSYGSCAAGQWTSFGSNQNSASAITDLVSTGNPTPLALNDLVWVVTGATVSVYDALDAKFPTPKDTPTANTGAGLDVLIAVIDVPTLKDSTNAAFPIIAFASFHITDVNKQGNKSFIQGHFIKGAVAGGSSGIGPFYGTYTPPRLAQ